MAEQFVPACGKNIIVSIRRNHLKGIRRRVAPVHFALAVLAATIMLRPALCAQGPPREEGPFRKPELVEKADPLSARYQVRDFE